METTSTLAGGVGWGVCAGTSSPAPQHPEGCHPSPAAMPETTTSGFELQKEMAREELGLQPDLFLHFRLHPSRRGPALWTLLGSGSRCHRSRLWLEDFSWE